MKQLISGIKRWFVPISLEDTLKQELYKAQQDLLRAEEHAELYTALTGVYKGRVARLSQKLNDQPPVDTLPKLSADLHVVTRK